MLPEGNGTQNQEKSYTKKYQNHIDCSYGSKLVCIDDKVHKLFTTCLDWDAV